MVGSVKGICKRCIDNPETSNRENHWGWKGGDEIMLQYLLWEGILEVGLLDRNCGGESRGCCQKWSSEARKGKEWSVSIFFPQSDLSILPNKWNVEKWLSKQKQNPGFRISQYLWCNHSHDDWFQSVNMR